MSEYWKSTPKYWCKHCSTYVKDTPFERKQHETTGKHQGNLKRFLRDIQNSHERTERDKVRAKAEVDRLKGSFGQGSPEAISVGNTVAKPVPPTTKKTSSAPLSGADQKRQWTQLADMGINVPEQFRSEMAMAGDWSIMSKQTIVEEKKEDPLSVGVKKRKFEGQEEEDEEAAATGEAVVRRGWGATTKQFPGQDQADLDDLFAGSIPLGKKEKSTVSSTTLSKDEARIVKPDAEEIENAASGTTGAASRRQEGELQEDIKKEGDSLIKNEPDVTSRAVPIDQIAEEPPVPIFKKRKAKIS